jgi:hypothetical protein
MKIIGCLLGLAAAAVLAGCGHTNYTVPARYEQGLVVILGGAGGFTGEGGRIRDGLGGAGFKGAIEIFEWSHGSVMEDQTQVSFNRAKASELAERVESYVAGHPNRPVYLVGVSAGTGLVVWALEDLGSNRVTGAVLIASSLDAKYDLGPALDRVDSAVYSFNSIMDAVLGIGVPITGTVDQQGEVAGGLAGFSPPRGASDSVRTLYKEKLVQTWWWPGDLVLGNLGDHLGATNPLYVRARIGPRPPRRRPPGATGIPADSSIGTSAIRRCPSVRPRKK